MQIPRGPDHLYCPQWRKKMSAVCHICPWWVHVRGANPNTGESVDQWNCAITWGPMLAIEVAQQAKQGAAATESFRNEVVKDKRRSEAMPSRLGTAPPKMIEVGT